MMDWPTFIYYNSPICECNSRGSSPRWVLKVISLVEDDVVCLEDEFVLPGRRVQLHGIYINQYTMSIGDGFSMYVNNALHSISPDGLLCETDIDNCSRIYRDCLLAPSICLPKMELPTCSCVPFIDEKPFPTTRFHFEENDYHLVNLGTSKNYVIKSVRPTSVIALFIVSR